MKYSEKKLAEIIKARGLNMREAEELQGHFTLIGIGSMVDKDAIDCLISCFDKPTILKILLIDEATYRDMDDGYIELPRIAYFIVNLLHDKYVLNKPYISRLQYV